MGLEQALEVLYEYDIEPRQPAREFGRPCSNGLCVPNESCVGEQTEKYHTQMVGLPLCGRVGGGPSYRVETLPIFHPPR